MAYNRKLLYTKSFPSWNTPEGDLGSIQGDFLITPIQLVALEINEPGSTIIYAVTTGALPTGLTLSSSGEISGTPTGYTDVEIVNFTITATDDEGETAVRDFSFTIVFEYQIDYLVVAGGGGSGDAGSYYESGGGGGGGLRTSYGSVSGGGASSESAITTSPNSIMSITVGAGGGRRSSGENSSIQIAPSVNITSIGGGNGGSNINSTSLFAGDGGSGGGEAYFTSPGGSGTSGQGFAGGSGKTTSGPNNGGGGGGASQSGFDGDASVDRGFGGDGLSVNILNSSSASSFSIGEVSGSNVYFAGGGGGGSASDGTHQGGIGGGADAIANSNGGPGQARTGGGASGCAGSATNTGSSGGSGVVILRMPTVRYSGTTTGSPIVTTDGSDTILTYTGSGTYTT